MAYGADMLYRKLPVLGISVVIILSIIMFSSIYPIINFRHQYSTAREFASFINITTEPDSVLILYGDDRPMMEFYTKRAYIDYPNTWYYDDIYDLFSRMNSTLESGKKVYLSETVFILDDGRRAREIYNLMNYEFNLIPIGILLWENPHISEVISQKYNVTLFRVEKKAV